jgi:hypothetical protein
MTQESKPAIKRPPVLGILSILVPIIGFICLLSVRDHAGTMDYMTNGNKRLDILMVTPVVGLAFIVGAWIRNERYLALRFIGLFLDFLVLIPVLFAVAFAHSDSHF